MAGAKGLEPAASCVTGRRSNQLNYSLAYLKMDCFLPVPSDTVLPPSRYLLPCLRAGMERKEAFSFNAVRFDRVVKNVFERIQKSGSKMENSAASMQ